MLVVPVVQCFQCVAPCNTLMTGSVPSPQALRLAGGQVLEPVMSLEVTVEEERLSSVLGDLAQRRGTVRDIQSRHDDKVLLATVPLAEMMVRRLEKEHLSVLFSC